MHKNTEVLLAGRSKDLIADLAGKLEAETGFRVSLRHIENGHADPLYGVTATPDIVVLVLNDDGHADLTAMLDVASTERPPMIVLAAKGDAQTMRLSMQAGARDFFAGSVTVEDLAGSIDRVATRRSSADRDLTVFVNAKGGSGATFLAANVAHMFAAASNIPSALLSLDLQFDSLCQYFDLEMRHGLMDVLDGVSQLDTVALDAYLTHHESGLRLLAPRPADGIAGDSDKSAELGLLLDKLVAQYEHVVVDMPRRLDRLSVPALERATHVVLVVQQTLSHLHDAARMIKLFTGLGIGKDRIIAVVNRYDKNAQITQDDIGRALKGVELAVIPSDFRTVTESISLGQPMFAHAKNAAVTKAIAALETRLGGESTAAAGKGVFGKAISNLLRI